MSKVYKGNMVHHKNIIPASNLKLPLDEQRIILDVIFHLISSLHSDQHFKTTGSVCFTVNSSITWSQACRPTWNFSVTSQP